MNKEDLVKHIAEKSGLTKENANKSLEAFMETVTGSLKNGEPVTLVGFGTFKATRKTERQGRNPRTGDPLTIPAATVPSFTAGKNFKDAVNS